MPTTSRLASLITVADERIALILEESRRALDQQEAVLDGLRSRTGVLLTAASIASSFLGAAALGDGDFCVWTWLALGALALLAWLAVHGVLWPRQDAWTFSHNVPSLLENYIDGEHDWDIDSMRTAMAEKNQEFWDANSAQLKDMFGAFRLAAAALLVEVIFWLIDLGFCG
jgi:hypothetical protein